MKNIKTSIKLLMAFGVLLLLFITAIFSSWLKIDKVDSQSHFLAQIVVPSMLINGNIERNFYEILALMERYRFTQDNELMKQIEDFEALIDKDILRAADLAKGHSDLKGLNTTLNEVVPIYEKFKQLTRDADVKIRNEREVLRLASASGNAFQKLLDDTITKYYEQLRKEISTSEPEKLLLQLQLIQESERILNSLLNTRRAVLISVQQGDVELLRKNTALLVALSNTIREKQSLFADLGQLSDFKAIVEAAEGYAKSIQIHVDAFATLEASHAEREPIAQKVSVKSTEASLYSQGRVETVSKEAIEALALAVRILVGSAVGAIIIGIAIALTIAGMITRPLRTIVSLAERAKQGDLRIKRADFAYEGRDELGVLVEALSGMVLEQEEATHRMIDVTRKVSAGAESLSAISEETHSAMDEVKTSVEQVNLLAESNGALLQECNASVEEMSAGAITTANAATDCAAFIAQTTAASQEAVKTVNGVIDDMEDVNRKSQEGEAKIHELVGAVDQIGSFVSVITSIADQTNLLALNAAIEAARAGDAGRGFAVVAEEVRKLAEDSARAAQNVNGLISTLQSSAKSAIDVTEESARIVDRTLTEADKAQKELEASVSDMLKANDSIQNIAAVAQEQAASSREMAEAIDKATRSTMDIVGAVADIRHSTEETSQAAQSVAMQAQDMNEYVLKLQEILHRYTIDDDLPTTGKIKALRG